MMPSLKSALTADLTRSLPSSAFGSNALFSDSLTQSSLQPTSFGNRSRLEIGTFDRVFSSEGSVNNQFPDVFRFTLSRRSRLRIYVGNEFSGSRSDRQMTVDLISDRNLRSITNVRVQPGGINAITRGIDPGTYRIRISTQTSSRGRYFIDMVRI